MIDIDTLIARGGVFKNLDPGEALFSEGAVCSNYYQLVEGRLYWQNSNDRGRDFIQSIIEPGDCFGELPLFDDEPYAADAISEKKSVVIGLAKQLFLQLLRDNPEIHFKFDRLLAQRLRAKFIALKNIALENPERVVLSLLNGLKSKNCPETNTPFGVSLTRQDIANMTGLRVETVIRVIIGLKEKGVLNIEHGKVFI